MKYFLTRSSYMVSSEMENNKTFYYNNGTGHVPQNESQENL